LDRMDFLWRFRAFLLDRIVLSSMLAHTDIAQITVDEKVSG
jgi:hypothetical protein